MSTAFITGIEGQDGSYLAELLLNKGYEVFGSARGGADLSNLSAVLDSIELNSIDLNEPDVLARQIVSTAPDELYHLAAPSFVATEPAEQRELMSSIVLATQTIVSAIAATVPACRVFFAGSSEMFGAVTAAPQNEATPFRPRAVYGLAKLCAHQIIDYHRRQDGLFACTGFLYNHESPRRGERFVTRKIARAVARISLGLEREVRLGDLSAGRDWGYAPDFVSAMWAMLQREAPEDFVIATGEAHTVGEFAARAFQTVGLDSNDYVVVDPAFVRPPEPVPLIGDATAIRQRLGWQPTRRFDDIVGEMVEAELALLTSPVAEDKVL